MALTGTPFVVLLWVLTVGAGALVVWVWPRVAAARARAVVARAGMLVGVNLLVVLAALGQLNHVYLFYADWTDLMGALGAGTPSTTAHGGTSASAAAAAAVGGSFGSGSPSALPSLPPGAGPQDRVLHYTVTGLRSHIRDEVLVQLPASYFARSQQSRRYPVLEAFHGYQGGPDQWTGPMGLGRGLDLAAAQHRLADAILVAPIWTIPAQRDTECVDGGHGTPAVETWLTYDVPRWVEQTFRVLPERSAWATIGFSAGGWCAAMATMLHPQQYAAAIVLGGYFRPDFGSWRPFRVHSLAWARYDLVALAQSRRAPPVALWLETSHSDPLSYPSSAQFVSLAHAPLSVTATVLTHAGHRMSLWEGMLPQTLAWLAANVPGFAPAA